MVGIGALHLANPAPFVHIMPSALPHPLALVYLSGACEIAGGVGILVPATRRLAAWGLVALYIAVFPANVNMAIHQIQVDPGLIVPVWAMWARLPLQIGFIAWAAWIARRVSA